MTLRRDHLADRVRRGLSRTLAAPALLATLLTPISAHAAPASPEESASPEGQSGDAPVGDERDGIYTLVVENDLFGQKDRNYTSGVKLAFLTPKGAEPEWARRLADLTPPFANDLDVRFEYELGQSLFTPEDLTRASPDPQDRPYAALLYGSLGLIADADERTFDALQVLVGVVGPAAQGGETQRFIHHGLGAVIPQGWDTQIPDRVVASIRYQRAMRLIQSDDEGVEYDLGPTFGFSLGNLQTAASAGATFRIGARLPRDFGPSRIAPSLPGSGYFVPRAQWGWYVFGGVETRYVEYDVTIDERGANGAGVTRTPFGGEGQMGLALHFRDVRVAYTQVIRTKEFRELSDPYSEFGALSITWRR